MRIVVVDVAAENGGALSILYDFYHYVINDPRAKEHEWVFITGNISLPKVPFVECIKVPKTKKSQLYRMLWDNFFFRKFEKERGFDLVLSLQNAAVKCFKAKQVVYFHNVLLLGDKHYRYSFFKSTESVYAKYTRLLGPYTKWSLHRADAIVVQTESVKEEIGERFGPSCPVEVCYPTINPIDLEEKSQAESIEGFVYPASPLGFKNHSLIIDSVINHLENISIKIIFTFRPDDNEIAASLYEKTKGDGRFIFTGYLPRERILSLYGKYALLYASRMESFPIPFIEAASRNSLIIAPSENYAKEIIGSYKRAIFFEQDNPASLAECMRRALGDFGDETITFEKGVLSGTWSDVFNVLLRIGSETK